MNGRMCFLTGISMRRAIVAVTFAVISLSICSTLAAQETHPGGSWGAWLTLPQYAKLQMRVKCEYWIADQNDRSLARPAHRDE